MGAEHHPAVVVVVVRMAVAGYVEVAAVVAVAAAACLARAVGVPPATSAVVVVVDCTQRTWRNLAEKNGVFAKCLTGTLLADWQITPFAELYPIVHCRVLH